MDTIKFEKRGALVVAHRGLSGLEAENTNAAFVAAGNRGYYGIETDIHRTADGRFAVMHDDNAERVAGVRVAVADAALVELQDIVVFDKDGGKGRRDLRVPSLEEYIGICKKYGKQAVLELKDDFVAGDLDNIVATIERLGHLGATTFISFHIGVLIRLRERLALQPAQYLTAEYRDGLAGLLVEHRLDLDIHYRALPDEGVVRALHERGVRVNCWTVDSREDAERLVGWGVDYITTNILEG